MAAPTPAARSLALARQGRLVDAKAVLEAVPAVAVSDPDAVRLLGAICLALGDAAAQRGDVAAALALYAQSVRAAPDNVQAHYNRGVVLYRSGRTADAAASYRAAIVLEPRLGDAHSALGVAQA